MSRVGKIMRKETGGLILRNPFTDKIVRFEGPGLKVTLNLNFQATATGENAVPADYQDFTISRILPDNPYSNYRGYFSYSSVHGWGSTNYPLPFPPCNPVLQVFFEPNAKHLYDAESKADWRVYLQIRWASEFDNACIWTQDNQLTVDRDKSSTWYGLYDKNMVTGYSSPGGSWGSFLRIEVKDEVQ